MAKKQIKDMMSDYEKEFEVFANNINQAARSFYYHREIQKQVYDDGVKHQELPDGYFQDSKMFQAMNANAQFWNDYKYSSLVYAIITLGRIFDTNINSHSITRLIELAKKSGLFTNENLKARKIACSNNTDDWIEQYMLSASELDESDFNEIEKHVSKTLLLWNEVKDIRNKLYAHQDVISAERKSGILEKAKYDTFEKIILNLLTVEQIFFDAFYNGSKPNFTYLNTKIHERVKSDVSSLLSRLTQAS